MNVLNIEKRFSCGRKISIKNLKPVYAFFTEIKSMRCGMPVKNIVILMRLCGKNEIEIKR